jgi:hypothetical protein
MIDFDGARVSSFVVAGCVFMLCREDFKGEDVR